MSLPEFHLRVTLEGLVALSEDPSRVKAAMANVLGDSLYQIEEGARTLRITSDDPRSIKRLHDQLRDRHVRAAARKLLYAGRDGNTASVMLNRQAAYAGVLVLCGSEEESPLGPLYLTVVSDELDSVIQWLTAYEAG